MDTKDMMDAVIDLAQDDRVDQEVDNLLLFIDEKYPTMKVGDDDRELLAKVSNEAIRLELAIKLLTSSLSDLPVKMKMAQSFVIVERVTAALHNSIDLKGYLTDLMKGRS